MPIEILPPFLELSCELNVCILQRLSSDHILQSNILRSSEFLSSLSGHARADIGLVLAASLQLVLQSSAHNDLKHNLLKRHFSEGMFCHLKPDQCIVGLQCLNAVPRIMNQSFFQQLKLDHTHCLKQWVSIHFFYTGNNK